MFTMGSLFAGIGGFDLGFERAGFKTVWQVEIDSYCQKVLAKNFPEAKRFGDIRDCGRHNLESVDVICGGFPCQDISNAGKRAGITGERSGLWAEMCRIVGELRPRYVVVENVAALLGRGMGRVLGDLAEIGYDAEWEIISAADVGAPHLRERVWIMAHAKAFQCMQRCESPMFRRWSKEAKQIGLGGCHCQCWRCSGGTHCVRCDKNEMAHTASERCGEAGELRCDESAEWVARGREDASYANGGNVQGVVQGGNDAVVRQEQRERPTGLRDRSRRNQQWETEPNVGRVAHWVPNRMDRLRGLGNAVVPQIPELIANRIRESLEREVA